MKTFNFILMKAVILVSLCSPSALSQWTWIPFEGAFASGQANEFSLEGNTLYVANTYQVLSSTDKGFHWTPTSPVGQIQSVAANDSFLFAGCWGYGIYRSSNKGLDWTSLKVGGGISDLLAIGPKIYASSAYAGVFVSTDNGTTWTHDNLGYPDSVQVWMTAFAAKDTFIFAAGDQGVFRIGNNATTWTKVFSASRYSRSLGVKDGFLFVGCAYNEPAFNWRSSDNGITWSPMTNSFGMAKAFVATDSALYVATDNGIFFSKDHGGTWIADTVGISNFSMVSSLAYVRPYIVAGARGGVYSRLVNQSATPPSGSGTPGAPYLVATLGNLYWITQNSGAWNKAYKQTADIDATTSSSWDGGAGFSPIGDSTVRFTGSYDGRAYKINGLSINRNTKDYVGLFGYTDGAIIMNVKLDNVKIIGNNYVGSLIGFQSTYTSYATNCSNNGSVIGANYVGGLIGIQFTSNATNCSSTGSVRGATYVGGLIGQQYQSIVTNCYSTDSVTSTVQFAGGLTGYHYVATTTNCYSTGSVTGVTNVGGLIGMENGSSANITNCYSTGSVRGSGLVGGLIGQQGNSSTATNCYSTGSVTGLTNVGGLIGQQYSSSTAVNCFWDMTSSGQTTSAGGTAVSTTAMKTRSTFLGAGWDAAIWNMGDGINNGYPYLKWQNPSGTPLIDLNAGIVTGSTFQMGSTTGNSDETPVHSVTLGAFYIDKTEITYEKWADVRNWGLTHGYTDLPAGRNGYNGTTNHPVTEVNWYDVLKWCNARSEQDGLTPVYYTTNTLTTVYRTGQLNLVSDAVRWTANGYRLPTEAEWEFAAKGGTMSQGYTYSGSNNIDSVAWYGSNSGNNTHPVATKRANELGIYDMSGNVWEWCWDWYGAYSSTAQTNPKGPTSGLSPVLRGGSFSNGVDFCRVTRRYNSGDPSSRGSYLVGFRCVIQDVPLNLPTIGCMSPSSVLKGNDFSLEIRVGDSTGSANIFGLGFDLLYTNTSYVDFVSADTTGCFLGSNLLYILTPDDANGKVSVGLSRKAPALGVPGGGIVTRLKFRVSTNAPDNGKIVFSLSNIIANDPSGTSIVLTPVADTTTVTPSLNVWPGDADNSGVVNQNDILPLGLYWGKTGPARSNASTQWLTQSVTPWIPSAATFADANGDGIVNQADVLPIGLNWGKTHSLNKTEQLIINNPLPHLAHVLGTPSLRASGPAFVRGKTTFDVAVTLGDTANTVAGLFGISFVLDFAGSKSIIQATEVTTGTFLGSDIIFLPQIDNANGSVAVGMTRKSGAAGVSGFGTVVKIKFQVVNNTSASSFPFTTRDIVANDPAGNSVSIQASSNSILASANELNQIPSEFQLNQNYPNPFNPSTKIVFAIPKTAKVNLTILDVLGREIATLVEGERNAGIYEVQWNASNVPSGIYFYRLQAGEFTDTKRMILLK